MRQEWRSSSPVPATRAALRIPYLTFAGLLVLAVAVSLGSMAWERQIYEQQDRHIDPKTGTWYADYDWQVDNRRIEIADTVRVGILWVLVAHGAVDAVFAAAVTRGWRGIVLGLAFAVLSGFLALVLLVGRIFGAAVMLG